MPLENYYETFLTQSRVTVPDGFGGEKRLWADGAGIRGLYIPKRTAEVTVAEARDNLSAGRFVTDPSNSLSEGDVLRRERDGLYLRLTSKPILSPAPSFTRCAYAEAVRTVKPL